MPGIFETAEERAGRRTGRSSTLQKVLAVLLALGLWFYVMTQEQSVVTISVPVVHENVAEGLVVVKRESDLRAKAGIGGHERFLELLPELDLTLEFDARGLGPGRHELMAERKDLDLPYPLSLRFMAPQRLKLTLEEEVVRRLPVRIETSGAPPEGYRVESVEAVPGTVELRGPASMVEGRKEVRVGPLELKGRKGDFTLELGIEGGEEDIIFEPDKIRVKVVIVRQ